MNHRPNILVLGYSGAAPVREAGGRAAVADPRNVSEVDDALTSGDYDGLLLMGGGDVDPRLYGVKRPHRRVYGVDEDRDMAEMVALDMAAQHNLPVLGICRGSQIMNVWAGGTLVQHVGGHAGGKHPVHASPGTALRTAFGDRTAQVVSLHHQHVAVPGNGIKVVATSHDGVAEAIESMDGRMLGVQFHPEMDGRAPYARGIFRWLVTEAALRAGIEIDASPVRAAANLPPKRRRHKPQTGVTTRFYCPGCKSGGRNLTFDKRDDLLDHFEVLHGEIPEAWR